jgi:hypothetical protein
MSYVRDARDRLLVMCEAIQLPSPLGASHAFESEEECSFAADQLPAFIVTDLPDETYQRVAVDTYQTGQEFLILLYVSEICDESYQANVDAWDLVTDCREVVADYFHASMGLEFDDAGLLDGAVLSRGRKATLMTHGSTSKYHGVVFRLTTAFTRYVG